MSEPHTFSTAVQNPPNYERHLHLAGIHYNYVILPALGISEASVTTIIIPYGYKFSLVFNFRGVVRNPRNIISATPI